MPDPYWLEFLTSLPLEFPAFGQIIRLRERDGHQLGVKVSPDPNPEPFKGGAGVVFFGTVYVTLSAEEIRAFLSYYLNTSTGARLLTLGSNSTVNERRLFVFRAAMYSWAQLNGPRDKTGKLAKAAPCICLITGQTQHKQSIQGCSNRTKDPCGLCHYHNKPGVPTLLNESILEYIGIVEAYNLPEAVEARRDAETRKDDAERREREAERREREKKLVHCHSMILGSPGWKCPAIVRR